VPTNVAISVTFDQEVDTYRLKNGGIFLEGPDESKVLGPGLLYIGPPKTDEDEFLASPSLKGIKGCDFAFNRVDGDGDLVSYFDYGYASGGSESGHIYRTQVVLTPQTLLGSLTEYTVYIVGDEDTSDSYDFGLSGRSVFDPMKGANSGDGEVIFYGGYTGSIRQQFTIEITSAGAAGTAEYEWWTSADPVHRTGVTSVGYRLLQDGVRARFTRGTSFGVGDTFSVWCDVPEFMDGAYKFSFTTSSSAPETLPVPSTLVSGTGSTGSTGAATTSLSVSSTVPADRAALIDPSVASITVNFSASLKSSTVTDSTVTVEGHAADGSVSGTPSYTETITKALSVSGAVLTITPTVGEMFSNNLISVTLDSTVSDTDGNTLGSDYEFFFGTTLSPFYSGIRSVRLRLGSMGNDFADETVAMAIWDASMTAQAFVPTVIVNGTAYAQARRTFVTCLAALILVGGAAGIGGGSVRKRLGDFDVSRSDTSSTTGLDDLLKECIELNKEVMDSGGDILARPPLTRPERVVKGDYDIDEPYYGRLWEVPRVPIGNNRALYSVNSVLHRRWLKTNTRRS
jgi:hypothetical protein